jgi:hypothetical protein
MACHHVFARHDGLFAIIVVFGGCYRIRQWLTQDRGSIPITRYKSSLRANLQSITVSKKGESQSKIRIRPSFSVIGRNQSLCWSNRNDFLFNDELLRAMKSHSGNKTNWIPLSDPIREGEIKITFGNWSADERTRIAIERQAKLMGFDDPTECKTCA